MPLYIVRYDGDVAPATVTLPDYHPAVQTVLDHAVADRPDLADAYAVSIERRVDTESAGETVWQRAGRNTPGAQANSVRLFVAFNTPTGGGNTVIDTEYEPYESEHVQHFERLISEHIGAKATIVSWQRMTRP